MRKKFMQGIALFLSSTMILSAGMPTAAQAEVKNTAGLTAFEQAFSNPDTNARPFMRWWIAPGRMTEEEVRTEMKAFADGGWAGVELQCLELAKGCVINDSTWNETMKWILRAGQEYGLQVDFTIGQMWPIATPEITGADDVRAEQQIWEASASFEAASKGGMTYTSSELVFPDPPGPPAWWNPELGPVPPQFLTPGFDKSRSYQLVAVTAVKTGADGSLDAGSVVDVLGLSL